MKLKAGDYILVFELAEDSDALRGQGDVELSAKVLWRVHGVGFHLPIEARHFRDQRLHIAVEFLQVLAMLGRRVDALAGHQDVAEVADHLPRIILDLLGRLLRKLS